MSDAIFAALIVAGGSLLAAAVLALPVLLVWL